MNMKNGSTLMLFLLVTSFIQASENLDSLMSKVMKKYYDQAYLQYDVQVKKMDSSRVKIMSQGQLNFKFKRPEYHFVFDKMLEKIYSKGVYYELNHMDSTIFYQQSSNVAESAATMADMMSTLKDMNYRLEVENETSKTIKLKFLFEEALPGFYMSMVVDKFSYYIIQNQFTKKELYNGDRLTFFYQMDFINYQSNINGKIDSDLLSSILKDSKIKEKSVFKNYKIESKN